MHYGLTWPQGISIVFQKPLTVTLQSPNGRHLPAIRAVQGDCETVQPASQPQARPGNDPLHSQQIKQRIDWSLGPNKYKYLRDNYLYKTNSEFSDH